MRLCEFTTLSFLLLFSFILLKQFRTTSAEAGQCSKQKPCPSGLCCSKWGWCGNTDAHCAPENCQSQCPERCGKQEPCPSGLCCSNRGWCGNTYAYCSPGNCQSQCPVSPPTPPPPPGPGPSGEDISNIISSSMFDEMLKHRNESACPGKGLYTYNAFINAARSFPGFGTTGDTATRKREVAAFFAQTSHETTGGWPTAPDGPYAWGYCFVREVGNPPGYCLPSAEWPCAPGKEYYGRGPIQISYNYNYGPCGTAIGVDLLNNPDLVATDSVISFKSAVWFWMTTQPPKPSCHDVITGRWQPSANDQAANRLPGFGVITNIINGGLECGDGNDSRVQDRIGFYRRYCNILGVSPGGNVDCGNQSPFGSGLLLDTM